MIFALLCALIACTLATGGSDHYYAYFWSGGFSSTVNGVVKVTPDAMVTVDYTVGSSNYGKVINTAAIPAGSTRKLIGNAPHHIGQARDTSAHPNTWVVGGGLLSFFVNVPIGEINGGNRDDTFLFYLNSANFPVFHSSYNLPGGCTDEFHPISNGWIVSQMCDDAGNAPGGLYRFNLPYCANVNPSGVPYCYASFSTWTTGKNTDGSAWVPTGYNPHGGEYSSTYGFIISDFVWPASLLNSYTKAYLATINDTVSPLTFRGTVNSFDANGVHKRTYNTPKAAFAYSGNLGTFTIDVDIGLMAAKFFPNTNGRYAFVSGTFLNYNMFLIDLQCTPTVANSCLTAVFDWSANFAAVAGGLSVGIPYVNGDKKVILSTVGMRHLGLIGYSLTAGKPTNFVKLGGVDFGVISDGATPQFPTSGYPGSHYIAVDVGSNYARALVINSFVDFPVNPGYVCGDLLACPTTDQAPGFMYNFHGARTAASVSINISGSGAWTGLTLQTSFNPNFNGRTPHSVSINKWN